ncbi:SH3 domain-containing protein [Streptomyces sp. AK04-3B]|uniref:SH3 domain-containing protein n=1 Tax=unclassified Streptomyces TaxID=2593676 RepID=UPI0029BF526F|nr:SH3 domain-containing protein [Streptomyces sp. AK04-3B]MDX3799694.1 SH3 domain-containing protein [Streptomyces sp. AK04-3B]
MSLRSALTRLAIVTAAGALAASAAVTPALADGGDGVHAQQGGTNDWQNEGGDGGDDWQPGGGDGGDDWQSGGGNQWQSGGNQNGTQPGNQSSGHQWQSGGNQSGGNQWQSGGNQSGGGQWQSGGDHSGGQDDGRRSRGRVTASELLLRSAPTRASQVIRVAYRGEIVSIFCRTSGQDVQGNTHWYLLTDGTWAWGSARYIETIGAAPRSC